MVGVILRRELRAYVRNTRFGVLFILLVLLSGLASLDGWNRAKQTQQTRESAEHHDRQNWLGQGANNPHGAAHFSRYAFRPTPALAALDPGVWDYAGAAVWMEAHHQNPATLRRAEDALGRSPLPSLSVAWVIRSIATLALLVLLFPAVAREREQKTLKALAAAGVLSRSFVLGKVAAALIAASLLTLVSFGIALLPGLVLSIELDLGRLCAIFAVTWLALVAFAMSAMVASARSTNAGAALVFGGVLWLLWAVAVPSVSAQLATSFFPDMDEHAFRAKLQKEAQSEFWSGPAKEKRVAQLKKEILDKRGASSLKELGFNEKGVVLQAQELHANDVFDRRFGELHALHRSQDRVIAMATLASPLLALQRLSAGFAGTDLHAQQRFSLQAERHRRKLIAGLNQDLMEHAGEKGMKYEAGPELWASTPDFTAAPPSFADVVANYPMELASLAFWVLLSSWLAIRFTGVAMQIEERS